MQYADHEIETIKKFIGDISAADVMQSQELVSAIASMLSTKIGAIVESNKTPVDVSKKINYAISKSAEACSVSVEKMLSKSMEFECVYGRRIAIWYIHSFFGLSDRRIGFYLNNMLRATVISNRRKVNDDYDYNEEFRMCMDKFCKLMNIEFKYIK